MSKKDKNKKPDLKLVSDKVKITKIPKAKDQPLTAKQLEFAQLIADGFTKAEAFRKAYDVSPDTKEKSIHEMASKTFNNVKVISRVKAIQHQKAEDQRMLGIKQAEFIMKRLEQEATDMDNNSASRIRALELMGKTHMVGLFADKLEIKSENINMTADELEDQLKDKLQKLLNNN
tara:strand:+ start:237 stop:761 length:525 start_codon:yes stop_codon:yes gene_type:complete